MLRGLEFKKQVVQVRNRTEAWLRRVAGSPRLHIVGEFTKFAGINHHNFLFAVAQSGTMSDKMDYFLRLPGDAASYRHGPARSIRSSMVTEWETLVRLEGRMGDFAAPRHVLFEKEAPEFGKKPTLVMTACPGLPLDEELLRRRAEESLRMIGGALAAIHNLPVERFDHLRCFKSAGAHLRRELAGLPFRFFEEDPGAHRAFWFIEHVLEEEDAPSRLIHGDPLPQNIIHPLSLQGVAPAVVDWEFCRIGDPAYDFALLFRGMTKLLGVIDGRQQVIQAYREAGGPPINPRRIHAHEACLLLHWIHRYSGTEMETGLHELLRDLCRRQ